MNRIIIAAVIALPLAGPEGTLAGFFDHFERNFPIPSSNGSALDEETIGKGLKEAISTATSRAVATVSRPDGYLGNQLIKILVPEQFRAAADLLSQFGFRQEVDSFVVSMNRAAEKAAPQATGFFISALKGMTFEDARKILNGGETAATDYFRDKTAKSIHTAFQPVIAASMQEVGVARSYKQLVSKLETIPIAGGTGALDLDRYVTDTAIEGLFTMLAQEEKKIRTNPAARGTELLKKVFGK